MAARRFPLKWLVLVALVVAGAVYGPKLLGGKQDGAPAGGGLLGGMGGPASVSVAKVIGKSVTEWKEFSGMFEAVNAVEVRPRIGGQITAIHFTDGAEVKKGQPLFTIDPRPYEAAVISAKGTLAEAQSSLARAKKLVGSEAISRAEFEATQSAHERALGDHKAAEVNLEYTHITAPISGKISRAEITVGNLVDPAAAPLLASIVDLSPIYVSFDVDEQSFLKSIRGVSAAKLKTIPVEVSVGNEKGATIEARIHSFDNQITPGSGTIRVRAILDNKEATLVPGLYARVKLGMAEQLDAILINPIAISTDQDKKFVLVVGSDNKAEYRPITLGAVEGGLQVVSDGLKPGEQIIVSGLDRARPGTLVAPQVVDMATLKPLEGATEAKPAESGESK